MLRILHDTKYDFIKYWKHAAITTIVFIALGLIVMAVRGVNYSIEFLGGTQVQLQFSQAPGADAVRGAVDQAGYTGSEITQFGKPTEYIVKVPLGAHAVAVNADSTAAAIKQVLSQRIPGNT